MFTAEIISEVIAFLKLFDINAILVTNKSLSKLAVRRAENIRRWDVQKWWVDKDADQTVILCQYFDDIDTEVVEISDDYWEQTISTALRNLVIFEDCDVSMCRCGTPADNAQGMICFGKALAANADSVIMCGKLLLRAKCFETTEEIADLIWSLRNPKVSHRRYPSYVPTTLF